MPAVVRLAAKAPAKIAGQSRRPPKSTAASARPLGGQIGLALGLIDAKAQAELGQNKIGERNRDKTPRRTSRAKPKSTRAVSGNFSKRDPSKTPI